MPRSTPPTPSELDLPTTAAVYRRLAIADIVESPTNPRKRFGDLDELALSIAQQGVLEPIIVRPNRATLDGYELVVGARRLRAATRAGLLEIPALVRTLTDTEVLEIQVTENLQRKDVHPLEEADAYAALMAADRAYTVEAVAHRVGRSTDYVYKRLRLRHLSDEARQAFERDEITPAHAVRLARLSHPQQARAFDECFYPLFGRGAREVAPVQRLDVWIEHHTTVDVTAREDVQHYLPELHQQLETQPDPVESLVALSDSLMPGHYLDKQHGLIPRGSWKEVKSEKACAFVKRGVVVHGGPRRVLLICAKKGCPKHWPVAKKAAPAKGRTARKQAAADDGKAHEERGRAERQLWDKVEPLAYGAIAKALAGTTLTPALWDRALDLLLGYDVDRKDGQAAFRAAGLDLTIDHFAAIVAFGEICGGLWDLDSFRRVIKAQKLAIDVDALVAQVQPPAATAAAAKKATPKKPTKTGTRR